MGRPCGVVSLIAHVFSTSEFEGLHNLCSSALGCRPKVVANGGVD